MITKLDIAENSERNVNHFFNEFFSELPRKLFSDWGKKVEFETKSSKDRAIVAYVDTNVLLIRTLCIFIASAPRYICHWQCLIH